MAGTLRHALSSALAALALAAPAAASEALDGFWIDSDGEVILKVEACGAARCGKVAWLRLPFGPDGQLLLDYRNPEPALRARPVCGLEVLSGFKRQGDGTWSDGSVYVSDLGMTFSGYAEVVNPKQVKVTGYLGISLFGQSEVWSRVEKPFDICWAKPPKPAATAGTGGAAGPGSGAPPAGAPKDAAAKPQQQAGEPSGAKPTETKVSPGALLPEVLAKP